MFSKYRFWKAFIGMLLIGFSSMPQTALAETDYDHWQNIAYIKRAFIEVALKNEYAPTDLRLVKWVTPIHYQFVYEHLPQHNELIESMTQAHMQQLAQITHHPISRATENQTVNYHIVLTRDQFFKETIQRWGPKKMGYLSREANCIGNYTKNKAHEIVKAVIIIPVDYVMSKGLLPACVVEENTQVLGLPNDSDWVNPSIANDASKIDYLTGLDYIMLQMLYDKRLKAGMSLNTLDPLLERILKEMQQQGLFQSAIQKVKQGGLYHFDENYH